MWDLPGPGLEPVSPALTGGFLTTAPPGKSCVPIALHGYLTYSSQQLYEIGIIMIYIYRRVSKGTDDF